MITLKTFEFLIPFGTLVNLVILDNNDDLVGSFLCVWPRSGGYLNYEVVDLKPMYGKRFDLYLAFTIRAPKFDA